MKHIKNIKIILLIVTFTFIASSNSDDDSSAEVQPSVPTVEVPTITLSLTALESVFFFKSTALHFYQLTGM